MPWAALVVPAELNGRTVERFCDLLTGLDEDFLRAHPKTPPLYRSGAFYRLLPEYWLSVPWAMLAIYMGMGLDCKSLACWRTAELRVWGGEPGARCVWSEHPTPTKVVYHVRVRRADGSIEDPSALLGMNAGLPGGSQHQFPPYIGRRTEERAWTPLLYR